MTMHNPRVRAIVAHLRGANPYVMDMDAFVLALADALEILNGDAETEVVAEARSEPPQEGEKAEGVDVLMELAERIDALMEHARMSDRAHDALEQKIGRHLQAHARLPEPRIPESPASGLKPFPFDDPTKIISKERPSAAEVAEHLARQESPASEPEETMRAVMRAVDAIAGNPTHTGRYEVLTALAEHERAISRAAEERALAAYAEGHDMHCDEHARAEAAEERLAMLETLAGEYVAAVDERFKRGATRPDGDYTLINRQVRAERKLKAALAEARSQESRKGTES